MFKTIEKNVVSQIIERKSKFIANVFYIEDIAQADKYIEQIRKEHHAARHNCYAYRIMDSSGVIEKQSDDGEPAGTAGAPILGILKKRELVNVLVIVTRYFGGILLGTGGLVKAYSDATSKSIESANEVEKEKGYVVDVVIEYEKQGEFEYICEKNKINIVSKEYTDKIKNIIEISEEKYFEMFEKNKFGNLQYLTLKIKENKYI